MSAAIRVAHSGFALPPVGFGTYKLKGAEGVETIARAIDSGYTLLDSAFNYENEGTVGAAVRASGAERESLIVTSKLPGRRHAYDDAVTTVEESLFRTGLDYLDLYLIHWPNPRVDQYVEAWRALIDARERGLVRAIGVCNFLPEHLQRLADETGMLPEVNQIELHPYFPQTEQVAVHDEHGIITEAWSPLGRGSDLLSNPALSEIATRLDVQVGQVVLAWATGRGVVPLPKSSSQDRQTANLNAADLTLSDDDVAAIDALARPDGRLQAQDPATYEEF